MAMTLTPQLAPAIGGLVAGPSAGARVSWFWPPGGDLRGARGPDPAGDQTAALWRAGIGAVAGAYFASPAPSRLRAYLLAGPARYQPLRLPGGGAVPPRRPARPLAQKWARLCLIVVAGMVIGSAVAGRLAARMPILRAGEDRQRHLPRRGARPAGGRPHRASHRGDAARPPPSSTRSASGSSPECGGGADERRSARRRRGVELYGFTQMALGALFTLVVATWHDGSATPVAATLIGAALIAALSLRRA